MPRPFTLPRLLLSLSLLGTAQCGGSPAMRAAVAGHYEGLRAAVAADVQQGRLDARDAIALAKIVAKGEVERAEGDEGAQRIRDLVSCASEIDGALERRAETHDALGAVAAMVRLDAGLESADTYARWARSDPGGAAAPMRPLGARALTSWADADLRRRLFTDPDEDVRRGALRAAIEAADPDDTEPILEAARLDPYPAAQRQAIRAAGAVGGERVALALRDLWHRADDDTRVAIVEAWSSSRSFNSGGRAELLWAATTERGRPALAAAVVLVRARGESASEGVGVVERAVKDGPSADRVQAIELASLAVPALREAVVKAESDADDAVATAARARMLEAPAAEGGTAEGSAERAALIAKLLPAASGSSEAATLAKGALARAGVKELAPILERDGAAPSAKTRAEAGAALAVLGDVKRAAVIAVDPEPRVRTAVSCAILRAWAQR
jgi:hypothetical protein